MIFAAPDSVRIFRILAFACTAQTSPPIRQIVLYLPIMTPIPELSIKSVFSKSKMIYLMWFLSITASASR